MMVVLLPLSVSHCLFMLASILLSEFQESLPSILRLEIRTEDKWLFYSIYIENVEAMEKVETCHILSHTHTFIFQEWQGVTTELQQHITTHMAFNLPPYRLPSIFHEIMALTCPGNTRRTLNALHRHTPQVFQPELCMRENAAKRLCDQGQVSPGDVFVLMSYPEQKQT